MENSHSIGYTSTFLHLSDNDCLVVLRIEGTTAQDIGAEPSMH